MLISTSALVAGAYGNANMADHSMTKGAVSYFAKAFETEMAK